MTKYEKFNDCEGPLLADGEIFRFACCDCGLVHSMVAVKEDGGIGLAFKREKRHTAQLRRHGYGHLQQQGVGKHKMVRVR
jgi:hypothetical protein